MSDCVFCKIIAGELPSWKVYETDTVLAFMDIGPVVKGHTLVIPKAHHENVTTLPDDQLAAVMVVARKIARAQLEGLGAEGVNLHQANGAAAGQVVPHFHVHVIPRFKSDGHHWNWKAQSYADPTEAAALAARIQAALPS